MTNGLKKRIKVHPLLTELVSLGLFISTFHQYLISAFAGFEVSLVLDPCQS